MIVSVSSFLALLAKKIFNARKGDQKAGSLLLFIHSLFYKNKVNIVEGPKLINIIFMRGV